MSIKNTDQRVKGDKYRENFDRIFDKKGSSLSEEPEEKDVDTSEEE